MAYEEHVLRELRLFLRNVTERLILDRRFRAFSKAADTEEVTDVMINEQRQQFCQTNLIFGFCLLHSKVCLKKALQTAQRKINLNYHQLVDHANVYGCPALKQIQYVQ